MTDTTSTSQTFGGTLTEADHKGHIPVSFDVPAGTNRLTGRFSASPARANGAMFDNLISLSLFGPNGPRGARHNNAVWDFSIEATRATPGYLPGPIEPGRWTLYMDTFRILGPDPVTWGLQIACDTADTDPAALWPVARLAPTGPGWYRGDLHSHTWHSDGDWDVPDLVAWARRRSLDFVTMTDHNTPSSHAQILSLADDALLTMGGVELTTHYGHALSLGKREWQEWRTGPVTGLTMPQLAQATMAAGATFVIAHPMSPGDPACTGCRWEYADMMPGPARIIEIWNGGVWSDYNEEGLALFRHWLTLGHRLVATAGTDIHGAHDDRPLMGFNHVYANERTEPSILAAVASGHNYLSSGPRLVLTLQAPGAVIPMGGTAPAAATIWLDWETGPEPLTLNLVGPAGVFHTADLPATSVRTDSFGAAPSGFVMAELRDSAGRLHAVTNPIFIDQGLVVGPEGLEPPTKAL